MFNRMRQMVSISDGVNPDGMDTQEVALPQQCGVLGSGSVMADDDIIKSLLFLRKARPYLLPASLEAIGNYGV